jgi:DNA gyrase subunit A
MIGAIDKFMDTVADLVRAKVMPDVTDIKNFSGKEGVRIVVELRKDADVQQNINLLYKKAKLEDTFGYNAMLLSDGVPYQMSLAKILNEFVAFYRETMTRKYKYLLDKEKKFAEVREGLITAVDQIDTIIEMFRGCPTVTVAKKCLTKGITEGIKFKTKTCEKQAKKFHFTELQADAILEMKLQKLIGLEMTTLEKELVKAKKNIEVYSGLVTSKVKMSHKMKSDILEIKKKYAIQRKTEIVDAEAVVLKKPEIKEEKVYALVNRFGYIKLVDEATYERNIESIPADYRYICEVMNTGRLFVFTEGGKCHQIKVKDVPMGRYNDKGVPLEQVSALTMEEIAIFVVSDFKPKEKLLFVTKNGYVKKVAISEFISSRKTTDATKLGAEDSLAAVELIKDKKTVVLVSEKKMCVSFEVGSISNLKKNTVGITGMKFDKGDYVRFVSVVGDEDKFVIDEKQFDVKKISSGKRGTKGKLLL